MLYFVLYNRKLVCSEEKAKHTHAECKTLASLSKGDVEGCYSTSQNLYKSCWVLCNDIVIDSDNYNHCKTYCEGKSLIDSFTMNIFLN